MNIRLLTSSAMSLALLAAALPGAALARGVVNPETQPTFVGVVVVAQDSGTDKPKAEGWQTGGGEMSDADCQAHADRASEYLNEANTNGESGDFMQALYDLDMADMYEGAALDGGCVISYPS